MSEWGNEIYERMQAQMHMESEGKRKFYSFHRGHKDSRS